MVIVTDDGGCGDDSDRWWWINFHFNPSSHSKVIDVTWCCKIGVVNEANELFINRKLFLSNNDRFVTKLSSSEYYTKHTYKTT